MDSKTVFIISRACLSGLTIGLSALFGYWGYTALMAGKGLQTSETTIKIRNNLTTRQEKHR